VFAVGRDYIAPIDYFVRNDSAIVATSKEEIKEKLINKGISFEEYKDERGADKTSRKQRCGDCYRKI